MDCVKAFTVVIWFTRPFTHNIDSADDHQCVLQRGYNIHPLIALMVVIWFTRPLAHNTDAGKRSDIAVYSVESENIDAVTAFLFIQGLFYTCNTQPWMQ